MANGNGSTILPNLTRMIVVFAVIALLAVGGYFGFQVFTGVGAFCNTAECIEDRRDARAHELKLRKEEIDAAEKRRAAEIKAEQERREAERAHELEKIRTQAEADVARERVKAEREAAKRGSRGVVRRRAPSRGRGLFSDPRSPRRYKTGENCTELGYEPGEQYECRRRVGDRWLRGVCTCGEKRI